MSNCYLFFLVYRLTDKETDRTSPLDLHFVFVDNADVSLDLVFITVWSVGNKSMNSTNSTHSYWVTGLFIDIRATHTWLTNLLSGKH